MSLVHIDRAIRLPAPDVEGLIQGRMIAAIVQYGSVKNIYSSEIPLNPP